jgi:hypothetical protein
MKKALLLLFVVFFSFAACKKDKNDVDKLDFTVKNMASLIGKSKSYIKQASPGTFDQSISQDDLLFFDYSGDSHLGTGAVIGYNFTSNKCDGALLLSSGTFTRLQYMMEFTEGELGAADAYGVDYYDGLDLIEEVFLNYDDLWTFVENNDIAEEDIELIAAMQEYNSLAVGTLGFYSDGDFVTSITVLKPDATKSTSTLGEKMKEMAKRSIHLPGFCLIEPEELP